MGVGARDGGEGREEWAVLPLPRTVPPQPPPTVPTSPSTVPPPLAAPKAPGGMCIYIYQLYEGVCVDVDGWVCRRVVVGLSVRMGVGMGVGARDERKGEGNGLYHHYILYYHHHHLPYSHPYQHHHHRLPYHQHTSLNPSLHAPQHTDPPLFYLYLPEQCNCHSWEEGSTQARFLWRAFSEASYA